MDIIYMDIKDYIKKNKNKFTKIIEENEVNNILEINLSNFNKKILVEIRSKSYKLNRCNFIIFSKVYDKIVLSDRMDI